MSINLFLYVCMWCVCVCMYTSCLQGPEEGVRALGLEFKALVNGPAWVLETELGVSPGLVYVLEC